MKIPMTILPKVKELGCSVTTTPASVYDFRKAFSADASLLDHVWKTLFLKRLDKCMGVDGYKVSASFGENHGHTTFIFVVQNDLFLNWMKTFEGQDISVVVLGSGGDKISRFWVSANEYDYRGCFSLSMWRRLRSGERLCPFVAVPFRLSSAS